MQALLLIRHAESEHHVNQELTGGWSDVPLTERGREQAGLLAARLQAELAGVPARLYASDLQRARLTAEIVAHGLGLEVTLEPALREFNNGQAAGRTRQEALTMRRPLVEPRLDWQPYPEAETWRRFYRRVTGFLEALPAEPGILPILVSHGGTIIQIVAWWLRLDMDTLGHTWFITAPASLTVLQVNRWNDRTIERLNDTAHLYAAGWGERIALDGR